MMVMLETRKAKHNSTTGTQEEGSDSHRSLECHVPRPHADWLAGRELKREGCRERKNHGFDSGMGVVFQHLARISPIGDDHPEIDEALEKVEVKPCGGGDARTGKEVENLNLPAWAKDQEEVETCPGESGR